MNRSISMSILPLLLAFLSIPFQANADDWPQFLGPNRNGVSKETGLVSSWPKQGPKVVWQKKVGEGYSGPVIAGDKLIVFHRVGDNDVVQCLNARTGQPVWQQTNLTNYQDNLGKGNGPRATPIITKDRVYTLGAQGWLQCLDAENGKRLWGKSLSKQYQIPPNYFGIGSSPILVDNKLLVNVGAKKAGIVAFDAKTGAESWRATTDGASYASPVLAEFNGKSRAVFLTRYGVVILDPQKGTVLLHEKWRPRYDASVNAATPLIMGNRIFVSVSYETGALLLEWNGNMAKEIWKSDEVMSNHYNTCIHHNGYLYGIHGRQEGQPRLRCVELATGKVKWTRDDFGCASMLLAEGKIFALTEDGDLVLVKATPARYEELSRSSVFDNPPCRAQIAVANGMLYARDAERLVCFSVRKDN